MRDRPETEKQTLARWARHDLRMMWLEMMKEYGSLYASTHEESMFKLIAADIEEELGFGIEEKPVPRIGCDVWDVNEGSGGDIEHCSCGSLDVYPFSCEAGWACEGCSSPVTTVWGCTECTRVVCDDCVKRGNSRGMTLDAVGESFEVTRERIRQIECKAIRKLQRPSRSKLLSEFFYEGETKSADVNEAYERAKAPKKSGTLSFKIRLRPPDPNLTLGESMNRCVELDEKGLCAFLRDRLNWDPENGALTSTFYAYDARVKWHTYVIRINGMIVAIADRPIPDGFEHRYRCITLELDPRWGKEYAYAGYYDGIEMIADGEALDDD